MLGSALALPDSEMLGDSPSQLGNVRWVFLVRVDVDMFTPAFFSFCVLLLCFVFLAKSHRTRFVPGLGYRVCNVLDHLGILNLLQERASHAHRVLTDLLDVHQ